jgi:hypothetical protein
MNARVISAQTSTATGYGSSVQLTENVEGLILYTGGSEGWVRLNVNFGVTLNTNVTGTFTLQIPKGVLVPDVEADDAADPNGRLRYYCVAAKNNAADDTISALGAWTAPLASATATVQSVSGETVTLTTDPASWPLKGFWIRKVSNNTFRYVTNRSGNRLYLKALSRGLYNFTSGTTHLLISDTLRFSSAAGTTIGKLLDLRITSGSLIGGNAAGMMMTSMYYGTGGAVYNERTGSQACSVSGSGHGTCDRNFVLPGTWAANDLLEAVSDLDLIAIENGGVFYDPVTVSDKPLVEMIFRSCHNIDERAIAGYLAPGDYAAFWTQQHILPNVPAHAAVMGNINFSWY